MMEHHRPCEPNFAASKLIACCGSLVLCSHHWAGVSSLSFPFSFPSSRACGEGKGKRRKIRDASPWSQLSFLFLTGWSLTTAQFSFFPSLCCRLKPVRNEKESVTGQPTFVSFSFKRCLGPYSLCLFFSWAHQAPLRRKEKKETSRG